METEAKLADESHVSILEKSSRPPIQAECSAGVNEHPPHMRDSFLHQIKGSAWLRWEVGLTTGACAPGGHRRWSMGASLGTSSPGLGTDRG